MYGEIDNISLRFLVLTIPCTYCTFTLPDSEKSTSKSKKEKGSGKEKVPVPRRKKRKEEVKLRQGSYWVLRPHDLASVWRHRDECVRERLSQIYACRVIQFCYRVHRVWCRISRRVYARRISYWYWNILERRRRVKALRLRVLNKCAKKIQIMCTIAMYRVRQASLLIHRIARGRLGRLYAKRFKRQVR